MGVCSARTIAKIKAAGFNKMDEKKIETNMKKLAGGCLVIENAGLLVPEKLIEIVHLSAKDVYDFVVILTGEIDSISRLFGNTAEVMSEFEYLIDMTKIDRKDMAKVANKYIEMKGFKKAEDVDGTLENALMGMESGNLDRMLDAIDSAFEKSAARDSNQILRAEDF